MSPPNAASRISCAVPRSASSIGRIAISPEAVGSGTELSLFRRVGASRVSNYYPLRSEFRSWNMLPGPDSACAVGFFRPFTYTPAQPCALIFRMVVSSVA